MKSVLSLSIFLIAMTAFGATPADIFVIDGEQQISCQALIDGEEDVQVNYGFQDYQYCYKGQSSAAVALLAKWKKSGYFYSGGGGGFELKDVEVLRGIVSYDLKLTLEDEVVPGEMSTVIVKPCSFIAK